MKQKVYELLRTIPYGKVVTYGDIATALGNKKLARVVGNILHQNEDVKPILVIRSSPPKANYLKHMV